MGGTGLTDKDREQIRRFVTTFRTGAYPDDVMTSLGWIFVRMNGMRVYVSDLIPNMFDDWADTRILESVTEESVTDALHALAARRVLGS